MMSNKGASVEDATRGTTREDLASSTISKACIFYLDVHQWLYIARRQWLETNAGLQLQITSPEYNYHPSNCTSLCWEILLVSYRAEKGFA